MNEKLASIADAAAENLRALVREHESKILEAWNACEQEAQDNEQKPKFKMALAITLDLDADRMETALSFGIRYKASVEAQIPDPAQGELIPNGEATVTLKTAKGNTVTAPLSVLKSGVDELRRQRANKK